MALNMQAARLYRAKHCNCFIHEQGFTQCGAYSPISNLMHSPYVRRQLYASPAILKIYCAAVSKDLRARLPSKHHTHPPQWYVLPERRPSSISGLSDLQACMSVSSKTRSAANPWHDQQSVHPCLIRSMSATHHLLSPTNTTSKGHCMAKSPYKYHVPAFAIESQPNCCAHG